MVLVKFVNSSKTATAKHIIQLTSSKLLVREGELKLQLRSLFSARESTTQAGLTTGSPLLNALRLLILLFGRWVQMMCVTVFLEK